MTEIYLIRHAQAEGNRFRIIQGHWDGYVTAQGRREIALLEARLRTIPFAAVYASDLYRARLTAAAVARPQGLAVQTDRALRELNAGSWEGAFFGNIQHEQPELARAFVFDAESWRLPDAETFAELGERMAAALERIAARHEGQRVAVVSHGAAIRAGLSRLLSLDMKDRERLPMCGNTAVNILCCENGRWRAEVLNDTGHLGPLELPAWGSTAALRHETLDPRADRVFYNACYRDAWYAAHGNLDGYFADFYLSAAAEHHRACPGAVMKLLDGDEPAGLVDLDTRRGSHAGYGWLSLLYLKPEYRGKGYGIQALARAITFYRALGRTSLRLVAAEDNARALAFYRREGFRQIGTEPGSGADLLLLEMPLRERRDDV